MRIVSGILKGRTIPFNNRKFGNARVTSDFVKEAAFAVFGPSLEGHVFLDPFAGSGQIGLEAWSRGATVILNERDGRRHGFIRDLITDWGIDERIRLYRMNFNTLLGELSDSVDVAYLDPPYDAEMGGTAAALNAVETLVASPVLTREAVVQVQHRHTLDLPNVLDGFHRVRQKRYGDSSLSTYAHPQSA